MKKIIDTHHVVDRFISRYQDTFSKEQVNRIIKNAIEKIIIDYKDESTTYAVWSKSTGISVIIDWRRDLHNPKDTQNHAIIITLPPIKKKFNDLYSKGKDVRLIVEKTLQSMFKLTESNSNYYEMVSIGSLNMFFEDGKMFDSGIAYCFAVK
jgi:phosphoglycolate phosphatase-like HAD superfamily hydrolase